MSGVAYRLAGGVNAVNGFIVLIVNNLAGAVVAGGGVYALIANNGLEKAYALLALPGLIIVPWLVCVVVALPLGFLHYVLTGYYVREPARQEYALLNFISSKERLYGARPSKDEIDEFAKEHRSAREQIIKMKMWIGLGINAVALIAGGVGGYINGMSEREAALRRAAVVQQQQPGDPWARFPVAASRREVERRVEEVQAEWRREWEASRIKQQQAPAWEGNHRVRP
jgi:hypothetical protein